MKIPLSWISLYSPLNTIIANNSIKEFAHQYSIHTAEIDGIEEHFLDKVVVGKVLSCEKHPESKKLSVVRVALGEYGEETILTGAANINEATYVPVAVVGAVLPGNFTIGERVMAGMMSRGMICGADEIGMSTEESTGIMVLENDWSREVLENQIGKSFFDLTLPFVGREGQVYNFPLRDTTFEIDNKFITNRPDLFSVVGNAREFHAVFGVPFSPYIEAKSEYKRENIKELSTKIETDRVSSYHLLKMDGIHVQKSPFGMSLMMERAGLSPKMDIVDITNCLMTELGQPMHAFDAERVEGDIVVRMAHDGEKILALNNIEYTLTSEDIVIADSNKALAIAGVIGGMYSAVSENTKSIIWESACFDPTSVRLTSQRHGVRTDASTRYEKSLDPLLAGTTFTRVREYMDFLKKEYTVIASSSYVNENSIRNICIEISYDFINMKAGIEIPKDEAKQILISLGFIINVEEDNKLKIQVPSWRSTKDVTIAEDIAEEVARVYGYEKTPLTPLSANFSISQKNADTTLRDATLDHFSKSGSHEVYNYSFTSAALDGKILFQDMENAVGIRNAFNEEYTHMRRSLAPRLLMNAGENKKHSSVFSFFEIGKIYTKSHKDTAHTKLLSTIEKKPFPETKMIAGVFIGSDILEMRKILESYLKNILGFIPPVVSGSGLPFLHPGASGSYKEGDNIILSFGKVHPSVTEAFGLNGDALYFEADFNTLLQGMLDRETRFHPISKYQTILRELNFILPENTPTGDIAHIIDATHPWIQDVHVDSIYRDSQKIGDEKKSVNYAFTLSNISGTISDDEAMHVQKLIIEKMSEHGYLLRM